MGFVLATVNLDHYVALLAAALRYTCVLLAW